MTVSPKLVPAFCVVAFSLTGCGGESRPEVDHPKSLDSPKADVHASPAVQPALPPPSANSQLPPDVIPFDPAHAYAQSEHDEVLTSQDDFRELASALDDAYESRSVEQLRAFFDKWHAESPTVSLTEITDPLVRDVYETYLAFYSPFSLERLVGAKLAGELTRNVEYVVVQDMVPFRLGSDPSHTELLLTNFRPPIRLANAKVVRISPTYRAVLCRFVDYPSAGSGDEVFAVSGRPTDDSENRCGFLNQCVDVRPGHWEGWRVLTDPTVNWIVFNDDRSAATVHFSLDCHFGEASMQKVQQRWTLKSSTLTGIE